MNYRFSFLALILCFNDLSYTLNATRYTLEENRPEVLLDKKVYYNNIKNVSEQSK